MPMPPEKAKFAPTLKSISPEMMINPIPKDNVPMTAVLFKMLVIEFQVM